MSDLISKTIRFPAYMVDYIESFPGETFSAKLMYVLNDYRGGDESTRQKLDSFRKTLNDYSDLCSRIREDCSRFRSIIIHAEHYMCELDELTSIPLPEVPVLPKPGGKPLGRSGIPPDVPRE